MRRPWVGKPSVCSQIGRLVGIFLLLLALIGGSYALAERPTAMFTGDAPPIVRATATLRPRPTPRPTPRPRSTPRPRPTRSPKPTPKPKATKKPSASKDAEQSGTIVTKTGITLDLTFVADGYLRVQWQETGKQHVAIITMDQQKYTYFLNRDGDFDVLPLQMGNGKYSIDLYSLVSGKKYALVYSKRFSVKLEQPDNCYLVANQYVNFDQQSDVVAKSNEICRGLTTEDEKVQAILAYIAEQYYYDYKTILKPKVNYVPDADSVLESRKGICIDFASLMACMLRAQGVPTKLVIGYADQVYHAWDSVKVKGSWKYFDPTCAVTKSTMLKYRPTLYY